MIKFLINESKLDSGSYFYLFIYFGLFAISWAAPAAYGGSQARGLIGAIAAGNVGSEPRLQPTPQLTATPHP